MGLMHDNEPDAFRDFVMKAFSISGGTWQSLNPDDEDSIATLGFDPYIVANEMAANTWINKDGYKVDMGMQLAILEGESAGGTNLGSCSGLAAAQSFSSQEVAAAKELLLRWKEYKVRDWSDIASEQILPDYSDYTGHCAAGEMGPNGILPSTGLIICSKGLSHSDDKLVQSCNFFDERVAPYAKVWWLDAIGYNAVQTLEEKFESLWGWNHDDAYRSKLIERSVYFNTQNGKWDMIPTTTHAYVFTGNWLQKIGLNIVQSLGLLDGTVFASNTGSIPTAEGQLPLVVGSFVNPYPGSFICGYDYGEPVGIGTHWGIDMCNSTWTPEPVLAMHSGTVVYAKYLPRISLLAVQWWISGNVIAIEGTDESGNKIWTAYGHGSDDTMQVKVGDQVAAGQMIMLSGSTGFSSGIHLHLGMKINDIWVNPADYLP